MTPVFLFNNPDRLEATAGSFESVPGLLSRPGQDPHCVVAIPEDVVTRRQTMLRAIHFHIVELFDVKFVGPYHAPVMSSGVHRETGSQCAVGANDQ